MLLLIFTPSGAPVPPPTPTSSAGGSAPPRRRKRRQQRVAEWLRGLALAEDELEEELILSRG